MNPKNLDIGTIGILLGVAGLIMLVVGGFFGPLLAGTTNQASISGQDVGMSVDVQGTPELLSVVGQGDTYKWNAQLSNTGTIDWTSSWVNVRIGKAGSEVVRTTSDNVEGSFYVEECSEGTDVEACREDYNEWDLQYNIDGGTWQSCYDDKPGDKVCTIDTGGLNQGDSKQVNLRVTVPENADGDYPLIVQPAALTGGTGDAEIVAGDYDVLETGSVSGGVTLQFVGAMAAVVGLALVGLRLS